MFMLIWTWLNYIGIGAGVVYYIWANFSVMIGISSYTHTPKVKNNLKVYLFWAKKWTKAQ